MFRFIQMQKVYIAIPRQFEDKVLEELGKLGILHIERGPVIQGLERVKNIDVCEKYIKLYEKIDQILSTLPEERVPRETFVSKLKSYFEKPRKAVRKRVAEADLEKIDKKIEEVSGKLNELLSQLDQRKENLEKLNDLREMVGLLAKYGMNLDQIGRFKHIFIKAGLLHLSYLPRLERSLIGTSTTAVHTAIGKKQGFIVLTGPVDEEEYIGKVLELLNFKEFAFPEYLDRNANSALNQVNRRIKEETNAIREIHGQIRELGLKFRVETEPVKPMILKTLQSEKARSNISRTRRISIIHGWIPENKINSMKSKMEEVTSGKAYIKLEKPSPGDKVPVKLENKGAIRYFELFTNLLGTPSYFELDPTPIFMLLYALMFGIMFGDIGGGIVFLAIGLLLSKIQRGFFGFSAGTVRKIGVILLSCGVSAVFFGMLYGEFFLVELFHPLLLSPLHDMYDIMKIALMFGVAQIILALILNTINEFLNNKPLRAALSGRGLIGLTYYVTGIFLALKFLERGMKLNVFIESDVIPLTATVLSCLFIIFISPVIEAALSREHGKLSENLMEGFAEGIESFISFIANSISYVRLAAFAVAHGALGMSASIFASIIGDLPSYVFMNILVLVVEGFSSMIQALRLMFYEFSTKFFRGEGVPYAPFKFSLE